MRKTATPNHHHESFNRILFYLTHRIDRSPHPFASSKVARDN